MKPADQDTDRLAKLALMPTAEAVRAFIAGCVYAEEAGAQTFTANQRAAAHKRLAELERGRR